MKVMMLGLRGFPNVQGGIERHAECLCPLLVRLGCELEVIVRSSYQATETSNTWLGVHFRRLWAPKAKGLEAVIHTALGVLYAGFVNRPDLLHIHAVGPALMTPLARLLGLRLVVTHHGPDYDRQKWGCGARTLLRLGERCGMRWANARIVISGLIRDLVHTKYGRASVLIPNGVQLPEVPRTTKSLDQFALKVGKYVLLVGRLVPEKRHLDLIEAFREAALPDWRLVLVGASDHPDAYAREVLAAAANASEVVCTGFQTGLALQELYANAGMFVLPSSHEGLPIAMLEALSYGLPVLASDIPANVEVGLPSEHYFPLGDVSALTAQLRDFASKPLLDEDREARRVWVMDRYDWHDIAKQTLDVYRDVVAGK